MIQVCIACYLAVPSLPLELAGVALVVVLLLLVREGALGLQEFDTRLQRLVLDLDGEMALLGVAGAHGRAPAIVGLSYDRTEPELGNHELNPLDGINLCGLILGHVGQHEEVLHAIGQQELAHLAGPPLRLLLLRVDLLVHGVHGEREQVEAPRGLGHLCAEELEPAHVRGPGDLDPLLAALLHGRIHQLLVVASGRGSSQGLRHGHGGIATGSLPLGEANLLVMAEAGSVRRPLAGLEVFDGGELNSVLSHLGRFCFSWR
mmetsp:Transcript_2155/g.3672  ORF Transcript_2155/g.3672 Transcript_2155/m.3672 type:complete len:261 (+) Transcript_2155:151-933(+)